MQKPEAEQKTDEFISTAKKLAEQFKTVQPEDSELAKIHDIVNRRADAIVKGLEEYKEFQTTNDPVLQQRAVKTFEEARQLLDVFKVERDKFEQRHNIVIGEE